jgi:hypothetical protein
VQQVLRVHATRPFSSLSPRARREYLPRGCERSQIHAGPAPGRPGRS